MGQHGRISPSGTPDDAPPGRRGWRVRAYLALLVALSVLVAGSGAWYVRRAAVADGRQAAEREASFSARASARQVSADLETVAAAVRGLSASTAVAQAIDMRAGCSLSFGGAGAFTSGHLDVVAADGAVVCSSRSPGGEPAAPEYGGAAWLTGALAGPGLVGPVFDRVTGQQVVLSAAPVPGRGVVAAFLDLASLGPGLAQTYGGARDFEFLVTTGDGSLALSRSVDGPRWAGAALDRTPFVAGGGPVRRDVDGRRRVYGEAGVEGPGWRLFAGADAHQATAAARDLYRHELWIILLGVIAVVLGAILVDRRITRPIHRLSRAIETAAGGPTAPPVAVTGPREVVALTDQFNRLMAKVAAELAERQRAEEGARQSERNYRTLFADNPQPMWVLDATTLDFLEVNDAAVSHYGYSREEFVTMTVHDVLLPDDPEAAIAAQVAVDGRGRSGPWPHCKRGESVIEVDVVAHALSFRGREARLVLVDDVTERERFRRHLLQSQRLESLGQLAGGIAHDFNNLLSVIMNYAAFVGAEFDRRSEAPDLARDQGISDDIKQIRHAAESAAGLTRQLLAFARREVIDPQPHSLNDIVAKVEQLLRRTLGEHIELVTSLAPGLSTVRADVGQLEQVLVNLAVNARDAMPAGGTLTIRTDAIDVDDHYASGRPALSPGSYVRLMVSDTGIGMAPGIAERAFEPFFTTKSRGEGTGLGLATIYGIITQAGGFPQIYSEPGLGTTFTALLPATDQPSVTIEPDGPTGEVAPRGRTVLVVEDQPGLLEVARRVLTHDGYSVLTAADGAEAINIATGHPGEIDLLITDVVMPGMLGKAVADRVRALRPGLPVLFMSGYDELVLDSKGALQPGDALLGKPFAGPSLIAKVTEVLVAHAGRHAG